MPSAANLLLSPAWVYFAPVGEAEPSADTIEFGEAWGGNWTNLGWTNSPVSFSYAQELQEYEVEQVLTPVMRRRNSEKAMIETTLAEITGANLNIAMDGTITAVAAGASVRGKEIIEVGGKTFITEYAFGLEGLLKYDGASLNIPLPVRIFLYKGTAKINGKLEFAKKNLAGIPLSIEAIADTSKVVGKQLMKVVRVTAKATSE